MKPLIKLICLINPFEGNGTAYENKYSVGSIYEGYYEDSCPNHFWAVGEKTENGFSAHLHPLKNFIPLAEWREKQINSILEDVDN